MKNADDVARCLSHYYGNCCHERTQLWILSALIKLIPHVNIFPEVFDSMTTSYSAANEEVIQVINVLHIA